MFTDEVEIDGDIGIVKNNYSVARVNHDLRKAAHHLEVFLSTGMV
jgi:hypothetical protein